NQRPPCAVGCSQAQGPSGASPAPSSARRTPGATDNTSPRSPRSGGLRPPWLALARPEHRPAAASQRSLQACIASLPLQSSLMSKDIPQVGPFQGGRISSKESHARLAGGRRGPQQKPLRASVLDLPVSPCLFLSLFNCQFKNVCGHRETRRTGSA